MNGAREEQGIQGAHVGPGAGTPEPSKLPPLPPAVTRLNPQDIGGLSATAVSPRFIGGWLHARRGAIMIGGIALVLGILIGMAGGRRGPAIAASEVQAEPGASDEGEVIEGDALRWRKSQVVLEGLRRSSLLRDFMASEEFGRQFHADWYRGEEFYRGMGLRWFVDEIAVCGLVEKPQFGKIGSRDRWRPVTSLTAYDNHIQPEHGIRGPGPSKPFEIRSKQWRITWAGHGIILVYRRDKLLTILSTRGGESGLNACYFSGPPNLYHLQARADDPKGVCAIEVESSDGH